MDTPLISVVIPTFNRAKMVCDCVHSVLKANDPHIEVVVVDDCSTDNTQAMVRDGFAGDARVRYVKTPTNLMVAGARNFGAQNARGDYLLFLDNDNIVHPNILTELRAAFVAHPAAGLVGALSVQQSSGRENRIWTLSSSYNPWTSRPVEVSANQPLSSLVDLPALLQTDYAPNCTMVPRRVFDEVGGFDASFGMMYEEADFGLRIAEAGYKGYLSTTARTDHLGFLEPGCVPVLRQLGIEQPRRTYCFARNRLRFARRHFNFLQILSVTLVFAPLSCVYYCAVALKNRRPDIAFSYFRGTLAGIFHL